MSTIRAHQVPSSSWKAWCREAFHLSKRSLVPNLLLTGMFSLVQCLLPEALRCLEVVLPVMLFALSYLCAQSADKQVAFLDELKSHKDGFVLLAKILLGIAALLTITLHLPTPAFVHELAYSSDSPLLSGTIAMTSSEMGGIAISPRSFPSFDPFLESLDLSGLAVLLALYPGILALFTSLLTGFGINPAQALRLSADAINLNWYLMRYSMTAALLCLLALCFLGAALLLLLPFASALVYVACQEIFLNRPPKPREPKCAIHAEPTGYPALL
jgi:hypothetical protein